MIPHRHLAFATLLTLAVIGPARALEWSQTQISVTPAPGAEVVRTKFEFKNTTKKTVHLLAVGTSCGCTEATPTTSDIAPGESGAVHVLFTVGSRTGLQEKEITILTDETNEPVRLTLKVSLPAAKAAVAAAK